MAILPYKRKSNSAKIAGREDFCQKAHGYYDNLKQNIWSEFSPVLVFSRPKDSHILFKVWSELQILSKSQILNES